MQMEIWKDIAGFQGLYKISNWGNVKSMNYKRTGKEHILIEKTNIIKCVNRLYIRKMISLRKRGKQYYFFINRLVWETFNGKIPQKMQIDHIDNNPQNNRLENLQLLTHLENSLKIYDDNKNYLHCRPKKIMCINNNVVYNSQNQASRCLNVKSSHINQVLKNKRKHTKGYRFVYYVDDQQKIKKDNV